MKEEKIYKKICEKCGKEFVSYSEKQVEWNYVMHIGACRGDYKDPRKLKEVE